MNIEHITYPELLRLQRENKYNAKRAEYNGVTYHSRKEMDYAIELDLRKRAGLIVNWERQIHIPIEVKGNHICDYVVDFMVTHNDYSLEMVEVKGMPTQVYKLKYKLLKATYLFEHPDVKYTVV